MYREAKERTKTTKISYIKEKRGIRIYLQGCKTENQRVGGENQRYS